VDLLPQMLQNLPLVVLVNHVACKKFLMNSDLIDLIVDNISMCLMFILTCLLCSDVERTGFLLRGLQFGSLVITFTQVLSLFPQQFSCI